VPDARKIAFVVSHTHWDREWYLPYHSFRVKLVDVVREVLDVLENDDAFRHFVLDGQSIVLEDYLDVRPGDAGRIAKLVHEGALSIGPWYVLPDEFLVSGEALVRNLAIGHRVAGAFGRVQKVGYLPDSFGHVAQMPQLLRLAGIDSFVYTRGSGDEIDHLGLEYLWRAPDGSEVLAINQLGGYCNAAALGHEEIWHANTRREIRLERAVEQVRDLLDRMGEASNGNVYLVSNGCDHFPPQRKLGPILDALGREIPGIEFRHASLEEYIAAVRDAGVATKAHAGELVSGRHHHILSGVWSARMYLKQMNDEAQTLLSGHVEPALAYAHFVLGHEYPSGQIESAWKLLLENHPHDSICGCSTDEVHREMVPRFEGVVQTGQGLLALALDRVVPSFAGRADDDHATVIGVLNTLPRTRTEVVDRLVVLQPGAPPVEELALFDGSGEPVPFEIVDAKLVERFWGIDYRTELLYEHQRDAFQVYLDQFGDRIVRGEGEESTSDRYLTIRFLARDLPPLGHACYYLRPRERNEAAAVGIAAGDVTVAGDTIENACCRVRLHPNGTFDLLEKATGQRYEGLNRLEDTEDVGDEYDYGPAPESCTVTSDGACGTVRLVEQGNLAGSLAASLEVEYVLKLPAAIAPGREKRSEELVDCRSRTRVRLTHGSPIVEVEQTFDNRASDHRLRAEFPTGVATDTLVSDGHFYLNRRPIDQPTGEGWVQPPTGTCSQQGLSLVEGGDRGLAVLNRGLPEIQATRDGARKPVLSLTLLRAVGWLSRDDFGTRRRSNAGPTLHTPEAQCHGEHRFRYAVVPFAGDCLAAGVPSLSDRFRVRLLAKQGVEDGHVVGGEGLLATTTGPASVTAVKRHDVRDTLVVRLVNLADRETEETLSFGREVRSAWRVDLLEERLEEIAAVESRSLPIALRPHEITTLEIEFA